jgi:hypothetical protein
MSHPFHQLTEAGTGGRRHRVSGVPQIVQVQPGETSFVNLFGGGRARPAVVRYLHDEVTPLLRSGNCSAAVHHELFATAAELTRLAGWMAYDLAWGFRR